jgi:hypothetical protein
VTPAFRVRLTEPSHLAPATDMAGLGQASAGCARLGTHATVVRKRQLKGPLSRDFKAHTGFEPVLPPNAGDEPDSGSRGWIAPGSELNPHLRAVLERLKERDRERRR